MSVLAYSELFRRITGIDEQRLETPFKILNKINTTPNRLKILKGLAMYEPISIGALLKKLNQNRSGGSYITIKNYFLSLENESLLNKKITGNKEVWFFSKDNSEFKEFILLN